MLNQHTFHYWKRSVEISLMAKNKLGFVNEKFPRPHDPLLAAHWDRCNGMVIAWLLHSVDRDIAEIDHSTVHVTSILQHQQIMQLLMGFNDCYTTMSGSILIMKPFPNFSKVLQLLLQEEKQREICYTSQVVAKASIRYTQT
ncbi:hypothetical protein LIER_35316 [Lithospermum erythrorhizon]|uniref:Retrotransposon Copia-like N-terminal domain-containing protein n=1 Tax=Lithospermum erythrorhizon TaxID=34254 RepID=A0AAV3NQ13_LITER